MEEELFRIANAINNFDMASHAYDIIRKPYYIIGTKCPLRVWWENSRTSTNALEDPVERDVEGQVNTALNEDYGGESGKMERRGFWRFLAVGSTGMGVGLVGASRGGAPSSGGNADTLPSGGKEGGDKRTMGVTVSKEAKRRRRRLNDESNEKKEIQSSTSKTMNKLSDHLDGRAASDTLARKR